MGRLDIYYTKIFTFMTNPLHGVDFIANLSPRPWYWNVFTIYVDSIWEYLICANDIVKEKEIVDKNQYGGKNDEWALKRFEENQFSKIDDTLEVPKNCKNVV